MKLEQNAGAKDEHNIDERTTYMDEARRHGCKT